MELVSGKPKAQSVYPVEQNKGEDDPDSPVCLNSGQAKNPRPCHFVHGQHTDGIPGEYTDPSGIQQPCKRAVDGGIGPITGRDGPYGTGKPAKRAGQASNI